MLVPVIDKYKENSEDIYEVNIDYSDSLNYITPTVLKDDKERVKFIKYLEKLVRSSYEYKTYIGILKNNLNLTKCTFFPLIDINEIKGISLEMHHYPFSLFDITDIVLSQHLIHNGDNKINHFKIVDEIMQLHFMNVIGIVPLTKLVHKLAHSGDVFINLKYVKGNYMKFVNMYDEASLDNYKSHLDNLEALSKQEDLKGSLLTHDLFDKNLLKLNIENGIKYTKVEIPKDEESIIS